jgi:Ala-tRNA(Pro) deacylase
MAYLDALGIRTTTVEHRAVFTVAEGEDVHGAIPGVHSKNLFLKDKKGRLFLLSAWQESVIDLKHLHERIGASGRLSFGSAELLDAVLGVPPGSVTPFALLNDAPPTVAMVLDRRLAEADEANFHPLVNTATTTIASADLLAFLAATGHEATVLDFPGPSAAADL